VCGGVGLFESGFECMDWYTNYCMVNISYLYHTSTGSMLGQKRIWYCGSAGSFPPARLLFVVLICCAGWAWLGWAGWSGRREYPIWTVLVLYYSTVPVRRSRLPFSVGCGRGIFFSYLVGLRTGF